MVFVECCWDAKDIYKKEKEKYVKVMGKRFT